MSHHIHTVIVSYNRRELTEKCVETYMATVTLPYSLVIVDNNSEIETKRWLASLDQDSQHRVLFLGRNRYPGYATNRGWEIMPPATTLLHRSDNDFAFLPGWCNVVTAAFDSYPSLGQLGLRTDKEELFAEKNVGGNNVISRKLWDEGLRYDERPWSKFPAGYTEDSFFTPEVVKRGWAWGRVTRPCIVPTSVESPDDPYYRSSWGVRRIKPPRPT